MPLQAIALAVALLAPASFTPAWAAGQPDAAVIQNATVPGPSSTEEDAAEDASDSKAAVDAELFYEILVGEMTTSQGDAASGYALLLDAARRSGQEQLYQRATQIALQSRSAESALIAARAWKQSFPDSREANRYLLQILVVLNRIGETSDLLRQELAQAPMREKLISLKALPQIYGRASDKQLAAQVVEAAATNELKNPASGPAAWTAIGRMRLAADNQPGALEAARNALSLDASDDGAAQLLLQLVELGVPGADKQFKSYLAGKPTAEARLSYSRMLLQERRNDEAREQLLSITRTNPEVPDAWLVLASLDVQAKRLDDADVALQKFIALGEPKASNPAMARALSRAYLMAAQIASDRGNFAKSQEWLGKADRISPGDFTVSVQQASLLAREGKLAEARALIQKLPAASAEDQQRRLLAEAQLLREARDYEEAFKIISQAAQMTPADNELAYEQAMLAEKAGKLPEMESLLRDILQRDPDFYHASNALGYSLADRNVNLEEAGTLIDAALKQAPEDPFILDSKAWLEFRLGNKQKAVEIFEKIFAKQRDAEIAAHYGEVVWSMGDRNKAIGIWREGLQSEPDNETLKQTLKRHGVTL